MRRFDGPVAKLLWRVLALVLVALGVIGAFVPVLPTVPFLLAAAWAAGHGWPALERRLLEHPRYGEYIVRWRESGAVPRRAKWAASAMMALSAVVLQATQAPLAVKIGAPAFMAVVAVWLWRRPEP